MIQYDVLQYIMLWYIVVVTQTLRGWKQFYVAVTHTSIESIYSIPAHIYINSYYNYIHITSICIIYIYTHTYVHNTISYQIKHNIRNSLKCNIVQYMKTCAWIWVNGWLCDLCDHWVCALQAVCRWSRYCRFEGFFRREGAWVYSLIQDWCAFHER